MSLDDYRITFKGDNSITVTIKYQQEGDQKKNNVFHLKRTVLFRVLEIIIILATFIALVILIFI